MSTILLATEKPFIKKTVEDIKTIVEKSGNTFKLLENYTSKKQLIDSVQDIDALIVLSDKITSEIIDESKNLKIIVGAGAWFDNIDIEYAKKKHSSNEYSRPKRQRCSRISFRFINICNQEFL